MPELPEVETVVRGLNKHIIGQTIKDVVVLNKKSWKDERPGSPARSSLTVGRLKINEITRRGKGIIINLTEDTSLLIHLKMTGQLIYISGSPMSERSASDSRTTKRERLSRAGGNPRPNGNSSGRADRLNFGHPTDDFTNSM